MISGSINGVKFNMEDLLINVIIAIVNIWSFLTGWIYAIFTRPWSTLAARMAVRAVECGVTTDKEVTFASVNIEPNQLVKDFEKGRCETMAECWDWAVARYGDRRIFGTREMLGEEEETQPNGKVFKKLVLGEYHWMTYNEADLLVDRVGKGLKALGQQKNENICLYSDTRAEWMITAQACFRQSFPVVTLYTNLGEDAVQYGLCETDVTTLVTSSELLPKIKTILDDVPNLKRIVYFEKNGQQIDTEGFRSDLKIISFEDAVKLGKDKTNSDESDELKSSYPTPSSTVIIMYTSGSTGNPKGVIITHQNLMSTCKSLIFATQGLELTEKDVYIAFLPLAHILELIVEMMAAIFGVNIGYSGANTLTDKSTMIKTGEKGDASVLQPTFMFCVPLICNRIYKAVPETLMKKGTFFKKLFEFCVEYKMNASNNGEVTPIMDKLIFKNVKKLLGGRIRVLLSGGAPLAPAVHNYIRAVFGVPLLQGYGLTETTACATIMAFSEYKTGIVGPPCQGVKLRLVNWEEGNYRVTDQPRPRGEIIIGGKNISSGYFKQPEKTLEEYFTDEEGIRWFKTGDIGSVDQDGALRIIDRKKDLVKLQGGEYVSLGKVESVLKTCPLVDNACVYGDSSKCCVVALVCPNEINMNRVMEKMELDEKSMKELVLKAIIQRGKESGLKNFEIPVALKMCKELWLPESGLVTAAFKLKRKALQDFYQRDLDGLYAAF